mmetsp:Transcript_43066/g.101662  ORF Transcript_43066/g.101662 Transcript_43066/m.101662 type:complete len:219 (+) Transcript_43066:256-912(+)
MFLSEGRTHADRLCEIHTPLRIHKVCRQMLQSPCDVDQQGMCRLLATKDPSKYQLQCRIRASRSSSIRRTLRTHKVFRLTLSTPYCFEQREVCQYLATTHPPMRPMQYRTRAGLADAITLSEYHQFRRRHRACRWSSSCRDELEEKGVCRYSATTDLPTSPMQCRTRTSRSCTIRHPPRRHRAFRSTRQILACRDRRAVCLPPRAIDPSRCLMQCRTP